MDFEYCEKCGKRVSNDDIKSGSGSYDGVHYFCSDCSPKKAGNGAARNTRASESNERRSTASASAAAAPARSASRRPPRREESDYDEPRGRDRDRGSRTSSRSSDRDSRSNDRSGSRSGERSGSRSNDRSNGRSNGRNDRSNDRSGGRSRDSYYDDRDEKPGINKNLMIAGAVVGVVIIAVVIWAVAGSGSKPKATPTPTASIAPSAPEYADVLAQAQKIFDEAKEMYVQGKNSSSPSKGIKKAVDHLEKAIEMLYEITEKYDALKLKHPEPVDKLLTQMQSSNEGWKKSMPIDVW